jgi:hypothetical protein
MSYKEEIFDLEEQKCWLEYVLSNTDMIADSEEETRLLNKFLEINKQIKNLKRGLDGGNC